jgi:hypothetical protein
MKQARQILGKDLRRLRWIVIAWFALVCARTLVETVGADVALGGFGPQIGISEVSALLSLMYVLLLALLVSRLVHDEPLVGRDAFWITRPIAPGALMGAKLAFAALFFIVVPVAGDVVVAAAFGTRAGHIARAIPVAALNQLMLVPVLMALAVVTPSLTRFVLAIAGVVATLVTLMLSATLMALLVTDEVSDGGDVPSPDPTPAVLGGAMVVIAALAVIIYQYRTRRLGRALTIAGIGAFLVCLVPSRWTGSFAAPPRAEMAAPPQDTSALGISLDGSRPRVGDGFVLRRRTSPKKQVSARARVVGVPPEFAVRTIAARSRLELSGGVVLQTGRNKASAAAFGIVSGSASGRGSAVEAALGGVRLLTKSGETDAMSSEHWPMLLSVDEHEFARHRSEPGRLTVTLDLVFERAAVRGSLPLADGSTQDIGPLHVSVVRVIRRATGCTVLFRRSHVETLFSLPRYADFMYVLRNGARGEAAGSDVHGLSQDGFSAGAFFVSRPRVGGRGFVLEQYEIEFPARSRPDGSSVDLDEAWIDGAELVILEAIPAGVISRAVTLDGFQMVP